MQAPKLKRSPFAEQLRRFRAGDPVAAAELLRDYTPVLREAVRKRLPDRLRNEFESLDFVQEVWAVLCGGVARHTPFHSADQLRKFLLEAAVNRVTDAYRRRSTKTRFAGIPDRTLGLAYADDPTPSKWVMAEEQWESIAGKLPESHMAVVRRLRDGFTQEEIAKETGVSVRTISRIVQRVQRHCEGVSA